MALIWTLRNGPPSWVVTHAGYSAIVVHAPTTQPLIHALVYSLSTNRLILSRDFGTIEDAQAWVESLLGTLSP